MDPWHYEPVSDLDQTLAERLRRFPREPDLTIYGLRSLAALIVRGWLRVYHRLQIQGCENLPAEGSFILAANHASHLDTLCLLSALPLRKLHRAFPAAAQDYFFVSLPRMAAAAIFVNALPFERQSHPRQSLDLCRKLLANPGNILILFPEGTRSPTGAIGEFRHGIGLLAADSDVPLIPCHLSGTFQAWPRGRWLPYPRRVRLCIGPPRRYSALPRNRETAEHITAELRSAIVSLAP